MNKDQKNILLRQVFSPSTPIKERDFFFGRKTQLDKIAEAINTDGQHAILYGERGVGKTSFANIMVRSLTNVYTVKVTCERTDNFKSLWQRAFEEMVFSKTVQGLGFNAEVSEVIFNLGDNISGLGTVKPSDIVKMLNNFGESRTLFVFDEFDNIRNDKVKATFADLIKSMSDNNTNSTLVLIGIADSIESLIGSHQSLERCLKQVKLPRMKNDECVEIINIGLQKLEIRIENSIREKIVDFASGFPHYVHLLCECGCREIINNEKNNFSEAYLLLAIRSGIENTSEQLRITYRKAILTSNSSLKWRNILFACANADEDEFNAFTITEIVKQYNKITRGESKSGSLNYNVNQLLTEDRGEILIKLGKGMSTRYAFRNPMMKAFVKLKIYGGQSI